MPQGARDGCVRARMIPRESVYDHRVVLAVAEDQREGFVIDVDHADR